MQQRQAGRQELGTAYINLYIQAGCLLEPEEQAHAAAEGLD
jgi:hypothetical protein